MQISGAIKKIGETVEINATFKKRDLVITTEGEYPQHISFQVVQENCAMLDEYTIGEMVTVEFDIRGREWTSPQNEVKYFNTLQIWKMERFVNFKKTNNFETHPTEQMNIKQDDNDLPF